MGLLSGLCVGQLGGRVGGGGVRTANNYGLAPVWVISGPSNCSVSEGMGTLARPAQSAEMSFFPLQNEND